MQPACPALPKALSCARQPFRAEIKRSVLKTRFPGSRFAPIVFKNSKIAGLRNLANAEHWRLLPLQGTVETIRGKQRFCSTFGPSRRGERIAPAVLRIFSVVSEKGRNTIRYERTLATPKWYRT
jgi:hypothetical protein